MKRAYITPQTDIIHCEHLCETIPVHFSQPGTGVVDGKETEFEEDMDDYSNGGFTYGTTKRCRRSVWDDFDR